MYLSATRHPSLARIARQYVVLTKPRIVLLAVFCAMIGMFMATDELPKRSFYKLTRKEL